MENLNVAVPLVPEEVVLTKRQSFFQQAIERLGETKLNSYGSKMCIDEYRTSQDITVRFIESGYTTDTTYRVFSIGSVKCPYDRSVFGVGYLGEGIYKAVENGIATEQYKVWNAMMQRCYSMKFQENHPTYIGCTVDERWHNYQVFAKWYDENFYKVGNHRTHLDKDILVKGNKVYSPETCVFVPQFINGLFIKRNASRGDFPVGVRRGNKNPTKFEALVQDNKGGRLFLGTFNTPEEAFFKYKECKENVIRTVADEFKDKIPLNLYNALIKYTVEIDD